jgi:zinc finger protein 830
VVKDNEIIWSGHLGSKGHRTNVGRQKELAKKEEERMRLEKGKRKATPDQNDSGANGSDDDMDMTDAGQVSYLPIPDIRLLPHQSL